MSRPGRMEWLKHINIARYTVELIKITSYTSDFDFSSPHETNLMHNTLSVLYLQ